MDATLAATGRRPDRRTASADDRDELTAMRAELRDELTNVLFPAAAIFERISIDHSPTDRQWALRLRHLLGRWAARLEVEA